MPSSLVIPSSLIRKNVIRSSESIIIRPSRFSHEGLIFRPLTKATKPRIRVIWTKTEPRMPPIAKSATSWFSVTFSAEVEVTSISGKDVPIDTIVKPITTSGMPPRRARPFAPSMKKSAETTSKPKASNRIIIE